MAKSSRRAAHRRNSRKTRKSSRGVFSTVYSPVSSVLKTSGKVVKSGLNTAVEVPTIFVKGASKTVSDSVGRLVKGVNAVGTELFEGANNALTAAFKKRKSSRKSRKASRKSRKSTRGGSRKAGKAGRKASRKHRKGSRRSRRTSRRNSRK